MKKILKTNRGEGYIDICVLVLCAMLVIALAVSVFPVFLAKNQLDTFAVELCREAEMSGRVGTETTRREQVLRERTGLNPKAGDYCKIDVAAGPWVIWEFWFLSNYLKG